MYQQIKFLIFFILRLISKIDYAQSQNSIEVMQSASKFLDAFNHFEWQSFKESFTDDASIFFPTHDYPARISGRKEFEKVWLEMFPEFRNNPNKDSLTISPKNMLVQLYGTTAIMSFHLGEPVGDQWRRTIVWVNRDGKWKIAHLHASVVINND